MHGGNYPRDVSSERFERGAISWRFRLEASVIMHSNPQRRLSDEVRNLRKKGGKWLKALREQRGLSQSQLAALLGSDHYSFISQLEAGRSRVPPERYQDWSEALGVPCAEFAREMLRFYEPALHRVLFDLGEDDVESESRDRRRGDRHERAAF